MKIQMLQDLNNRGIPPLISFKTTPEIINKPDKNQESLKVEIKTQTGETNSKA